MDNERWAYVDIEVLVEEGGEFEEDIVEFRKSRFNLSRVTFYYPSSDEGVVCLVLGDGQSWVRARSSMSKIQLLIEGLYS